MGKDMSGRHSLEPRKNIIRNNRGFTLIELIIVIIVIGILSAVAIPRYMEIREEAADATARGILGALRGANSIIFANKNLTNDNTDYTMSDVVTNAQVQGIETELVADPNYTITFSNRTYVFTLTPPVMPSTPGIVNCTSVSDGTDCSKW